MAAKKLTVEPLSKGIGADIRGVDLARLSDAEFDTIYEAWLHYQVLRFRGQELGDAQLVEFSRRFGDLDIAPPNENGQRFVEGFPEILVISNVVENGIEIGSLGSGEAVWHTDMSYIEHPPVGSILYSWEIPAQGGNTGFLNMYSALAGLPADLRERIFGLRLKHDATTNSAGYLRAGIEDNLDVKTSPGAIHPMVIEHPQTGRPALYLGRRHRAYIVGLPLEESEDLLDELWRHAMRPEYCWHQQWRVGDLLIWDNRCTMHRRDAFDPDSRRIMHRTQIKGGESPRPARRH